MAPVHETMEMLSLGISHLKLGMKTTMKPKVEEKQFKEGDRDTNHL